MTKSLIEYRHIMSPQDASIPHNFIVTGVIVTLHRYDKRNSVVKFTENLTRIITKVKEIFGFGKVESHPSEFKIDIEAPNVSKRQILDLASGLGRQFSEHLGYTVPVVDDRQFEFRFELKLEYSHISSGVSECVAMCDMCTDDLDLALTTLGRLELIRKNPMPILLLPDNGP